MAKLAYARSQTLMTDMNYVVCDLGRETRLRPLLLLGEEAKPHGGSASGSSATNFAASSKRRLLPSNLRHQSANHSPLTIANEVFWRTGKPSNPGNSAGWARSSHTTRWMAQSFSGRNLGRASGIL